MKRAGGLFGQVADVRAVTAAAWRAAQWKRQRPEVGRFLEALPDEAAQIVAALRAGSYRFSHYSKFRIRDPKSRTIHAPAFRDRVVHHAVIGATGPVLERGATSRSYACRKGRGQHAALGRVCSWMGRGDWFLKIDIERFYDSIGHAVLAERLARRFRERRLLALFGALLGSYHTRPGFGLPIGALTSQYLGNFMLDPLDHFLLEDVRMPRFVRYMDDILVLGSRDGLRDASVRMVEFLGGLELRPKGHPVLNRCALGVPFLGFTLYPDRVRLDRRGRRRLRRKWHALERAPRGDALQLRAEALFAHACTADDAAWRREVCRFSRFGEGQETAAPRPARRLVEQHGEELPRRLPQQEPGGQPEQEHRLPRGFVSRHGGREAGVDAPAGSPDVSPPRAPEASATGDEPARKPPPTSETCPGGAGKAVGGAAREEGTR